MGGRAKLVKNAVAPANRSGSFFWNKTNASRPVRKKNFISALIFDSMVDLN